MSASSIQRRLFLKGAVATTAGLATGASLFSSPAFAANFPARTIDALIPFSPGGGTDRSVRVLTGAWEPALNTRHRFRPNNQPGAGTLIAHTTLKNSRPDGHTIMVTPMPHVAWLSILEPQASFDLNQIAWVGSFFQDPNVLLVAKDSPYQTARELIDDAKKTRKTLTASVSSPMSAAHAATVIFREKAGINLKVVPFAGGAEARNAVAGGHVDCCMAPYWSAVNVLELTRALCIFAPEDRSTGLWDAPAASQALDFEMPDLSEPYSVLVSAKTKETSPEHYQTLVTTFKEAVESQKYQKDAVTHDLQFFSSYWDPATCDKFISDYVALIKEYTPAMEADIQSM